VVTGVSKGIGAATARELAARGCHVFGSVRRPADAAALTADLTPARFTPLVFDVTDGDAVAAAVAVVDAALAGRTLFGLVNNAGMHAGIDPVAVVTADTLRRQMEVNLIAPVMVTQAFLPLLGADRGRAGAPGRIVMMSSVYGNYGVPWNVRERKKRGGRERGLFFIDQNQKPTKKTTPPPPPLSLRAPTPPPSLLSKVSPSVFAASWPCTG
jgi:NAD(P)-dependent dehydrogenase (short-subunit alcohol dehydrogenase family)